MRSRIVENDFEGTAAGSRRRLVFVIHCLVLAVCIALKAEAAAAEEATKPMYPDDLLSMTIEELMNIEVTSVSKTPEPLSEAAASVYVIPGGEIRRSGASSIPEALRLADHLNVAQKNSHDWGISARGFNTDLANKLLVLIDGRTVYTPLFSGVFWDRQDTLLEDIDRIEVINGPDGALWGANAVNGVINIMTKSAKETQGVYWEAGGGTALRGFTGIRYGGTLAPDVYYRVYGKYFDRGNEVFADGSEASDAWHMASGGFRIDAEGSLKNYLTLQGDIYSGDENLTTGGVAEISGGNLLGRWSHTFSHDSDMSLQLYYDQTHLSMFVPALVINSIVFAPAGTFEDDLDTYDLDFQHRFRLGERNRFVWGLGYRFTRDVVGNAPGLAFFPPVLNQSLFSGFIQDEITLRENLTLTLGTKVEYYDYTGLELEPSARLAWTPLERQILWAAISRAVRTPSRIDRDLSQPAPPLVLLAGGSDFDSEKLIAYELGYRAQLGQKIFGSISTFYNDYDDIRSTSTTPGTILPFFFENNLEGKTYGFEISANYQALSWWRLHGGYNRLKEHIRVKPGESDFNNARNETGDPEQQFSFRSSMDLPQNVELDAALRWVDTLQVNNAGAAATVPSYFELDIRLGWRPTKELELSVVGQNLLHDHHPEFGPPGSNRVEIQRAVYGKIAWRY